VRAFSSGRRPRGPKPNEEWSHDFTPARTDFARKPKVLTVLREYAGEDGKVGIATGKWMPECPQIMVDEKTNGWYAVLEASPVSVASLKDRKVDPHNQH